MSNTKILVSYDSVLRDDCVKEADFYSQHFASLSKFHYVLKSVNSLSTGKI